MLMVFYVQTEKRIGLAILVARAFKPKASRVRIFLKLAALMRLYIKATAKPDGKMLDLINQI